MTRALALAVVLLHGAGIAAAATRLVVTSRPDHGTARFTYSSSDAIAGLDKGGAGDTADVSAEIYLRQSGATTIFHVPAGARDGRAGWSVNDEVRATYVNRDAPDGPSSALRTMFANGRRVRFLAKSLGDQTPLALGGAPGTGLDFAYVITNGGVAHRHCMRFEPTRCTYAALDGGTGWKLRCDDGVADLSCAAAPTCGNGILEPGEQCDGGAGCTPQCLQGFSSCCQGAGQCFAAPSFSLQYYLAQYCSLYGPTTPRPGEFCGADGMCADQGIDPVPVCCQLENMTCYEGTASSFVGLWYFQYYCLQGTGIGGPRHIAINATCDASGACVSQ